MLDAHCAHLGANLAEGGCVVDDGLQCPFHGWVWSGEGRNVRIPYEDRPSSARQLRSWPVIAEALGYNAAHEPDGVSLILIATTPVDADSANVFGTFGLRRASPSRSEA